jgi:hypothetical protein
LFATIHRQHNSAITHNSILNSWCLRPRRRCWPAWCRAGTRSGSRSAHHELYVVFAAPLWVRKHGIRLVDGLELLCSFLLVTMVAIWVPPHGESTKIFLEELWREISWQTQGCVVRRHRSAHSHSQDSRVWARLRVLRGSYTNFAMEASGFPGCPSMKKEDHNAREHLLLVTYVFV